MTEYNQTEKEEEEDGEGYDLRGEAFAFLWETLKIVIIALAIIIPLRTYVVQPFFVRGASMNPTFENNDYILIDEISYQFKDPERGDIVVFRSPEDHSQFFIKRIIGLPNETVEIKDNKVKIHNLKNPEGVTLIEPYLSGQQYTEGEIKFKLDSNEYYVLGDNRLQSSDSRRWGAVNRVLITGKVLMRVWPAKQFEIFNSLDYKFQ